MSGGDVKAVYRWLPRKSADTEEWIGMSGAGDVHGPWTFAGEPSTHRLIEAATLPSILQRLEQVSSEPALTWYPEGAKPKRWDYGRLLHGVARLAAELRNQYGIARGDRIVVASNNCPEVYLAYLAILSIGAVAVPIRPDEPARHVRFVLDKVRPVLALVGRDAEDAMLSGCDMPVARAEVLLDKPEVLRAMKIPSAEVEPDDLAVILFTSGTTASPKGVCLSHYNLLINAEGLVRAHRRDTNRTHLCVLPLFHANAFGLSMIGSLYAAGHVLMMENIGDARLWRTLEEERVDFISAVPQVLRALSERPSSAGKQSSPKFAISAAAPLSKSEAKAFESRTTIPIHQGYGLSECTNFATSIAADVPPAIRTQLMTKWSVPSIGSAIFGTAIKIARPDGSMAAVEEEGEILVSGHNVMLRYWEAPDETRAAFDGGWLRTGDLGFHVVLEETTYFFLTGRIKDIIIRHGENISPRAVEEELADIGQLGPFAVCGFPNEAVGEEIGVYIQAAYSEQAGNSVKTLLARCPGRYRPRIALIGSMELPTTPTGKVQKKILAKRFLGFKRVRFGNSLKVVVDG